MDVTSDVDDLGDDNLDDVDVVEENEDEVEVEVEDVVEEDDDDLLGEDEDEIIDVSDKLPKIREAFKKAEKGVKTEIKDILAKYGGKLITEMSVKDVVAIEKLLDI